MKSKPQKMIKGFSLLELMITVTVAGMIAAFSIPNYTSAQNRANEKDIIHQMKMIHTAQNSNFGRTSPNTFAPTSTTVADLNTNLGLNIIANGNTYAMVQGVGGTSYTLTVSRTGAGAMRIQLTNEAWDPKYSGAAQGNPRCVSGCPALK